MEFLKFHNLNFETLLYMKDGLEINQLKEIIDKLNVNPIDLVRRQEKIWKENFKGTPMSDPEIVSAMVNNPKLIERPIVIHKNKAVIGRPTSDILSII